MAMAEPTLYRYAFPNSKHEGWAVFLLDSFGMLSVASDFGNYVYHWPRNGWGPGDFRKFLLQCDGGYLISKLGSGRTVRHGQRTEANIREHILYYRRCGSYDRDFARREWDLLHSLDFDSDLEIHEWYLATGLDDAGEMIAHGPEPQLLVFMEKVWPRLREALSCALDGGEAK